TLPRAPDPPYSCTLPPPPTSPLFPYTTLFRSAKVIGTMNAEKARVILVQPFQNRKTAETVARQTGAAVLDIPQQPGAIPHTDTRSEEHTSELQSPDHLVCRLLLEKKKKEI